MLSGTLSLLGRVGNPIFYYDADFPRSGNTGYLAERCVLDLRIPKEAKNFPTLIWFHGGGLTSGDKHYPDGIDPKRIAIAAVSYRLSGPRAECPDYIYDAAAAASWVLKHIGEYGGDPGQVYVAGHSAGGYLAAMIALDVRYMKTFGTTPNSFAGVFPISGQMTTHFQVLAERRAKNPKTPDIMLDEFAPISCARKNAPPLLFLVGDTDLEWPARVEENLLMEARLRRNFGDKQVRIMTFPSFDHATVCAPSAAVINHYILTRFNTAR